LIKINNLWITLAV